MSDPRPGASERTLSSELDGVQVTVVTRMGFPEWDEIGQSMRLLALHAEVRPNERVLISPCGHGALGVWADRSRPQQTLLRDTNVVAVEMARRTLAASGVNEVEVSLGLPAPPNDTHDVVLMTLPKGRDLARLYLLSAYGALRDGGRLYLAGGNRAGIKSVLADAEALYGPASVLGYKGGHRVALLTRPGRDQAPELPAIFRAPGLADDTYAEFEVTVGDEIYRVRSRPGVFSWEHMDAGTRLLLEHTEVHVTDRVLDVGCGYGIIGMHATRQATKGHATLVDVDLLACQSATATLKANDIERAEVILGDGLDAVGDRRYTLIVSNPPFHSGHQVSLETAQAFVHGAYASLESRGRLVIVANRFLRYDSVMREVFGAVTTIAQTSRYHLLMAEKARQRQAPGRKKTVDKSGDYEETIYQIPD